MEPPDATVIVTTLLFAAAHYTSQGMPGVQQALVTGLVFGALYARARALPLVMIVHAAFDLAAAYLIYHRLETTVAHWFFR
jgi:membrane protease YdiL (CAAX protease family)